MTGSQYINLKTVRSTQVQNLHWIACTDSQEHSMSSTIRLVLTLCFVGLCHAPSRLDNIK